MSEAANTTAAWTELAPVQRTLRCVAPLATAATALSRCGPPRTPLRRQRHFELHLTSPPIRNTGIIYSSEVRDLGDLLSDDEAAEREAAAQGGVPGYCGDR